MILLNRKILLLLILTLVFACSKRQELFINYSNSQIVYSGRIDSSQVKGVELYWSGTSIKFNFEGESISALFEDEKGDNYYNVIIDNDSFFILRPGTLKATINLLRNYQKVNIQLKFSSEPNGIGEKLLFTDFK